MFVNDRGRRRLGNGRLETTREAVARLSNAGFSRPEIGRELNISKATVAYHFRNLGVSPDERFARRYNWAEVQAEYDSGLSVRQCAARFGFSLASWHKAVARGDIVPRPVAMPIEELLVAGRRQTGRNHLKLRLIAEGLKENACEECGLDHWLGDPIAMQLHHRNGDKHDNTLENLQLLCPNCHSLTGNWGGRNKGKSGPADPAGQS
jgi:hypothetical protein